MIKELFKANNIKLTKQRELVFNVVKELNTRATVKEICDKCRDKVNTSTIYRIMDLFINKKILIKNLDVNGDVYYTFSDNKHIHHIECIKCHKKSKICFCPLKDIEGHLLNENGYTLISHTVKLIGICESCNKLIAKKSKTFI